MSDNLLYTTAGAARNKNRAFAEDYANEIRVWRWFEKFCAGDMSFKIEEYGRPNSAIDNDYMKALVELNPLQMVRKLVAQLGHSAITTSW